MAPLPPLILLLLASAALVGGELNVWFERRMLETVLSRMLMISLKNPLRPRCKPRGNPEQLQHMLPFTERYPIVADGHLLSGMYFDSPSRAGVTLAFDINSFTVHWSTATRDKSPADRVQYKFLGLSSQNTSVLHHPSLDVPRQGFVPVADSSFQMSLRCSNSVAGIAAFEVHAVFQWPDRPERRPIVMKHLFRKACLTSGDLTELQHKCHCRKKCEKRFRSRFKRLRASSSAPEHAPSPAQRRPARGQRKRARARMRDRRRRLRQRRKRCQELCRADCRGQSRSCGPKD